MGYSRKNTHPPDRWQTGNSRRRGQGLIVQEIRAGGRDLNPKNSFLGVTFNFNFNWYILTKNFAMGNLSSSLYVHSVLTSLCFKCTFIGPVNHEEPTRWMETTALPPSTEHATPGTFLQFPAHPRLCFVTSVPLNEFLGCLNKTEKHNWLPNLLSFCTFLRMFKFQVSSLMFLRF